MEGLAEEGDRGAYMQEWSCGKPSGVAEENRPFALVVSEDSL